MAFERRRFNRAAVVEKAKENATAGKTISYLNTPVKKYVLHTKKNRLSIIPFVVSKKNIDGIDIGELWYKAQVFVHSGVGVNKQMVLCPAKMLGKRCPICERNAALEQEGVEWDDPERQQLRAKKREVYNVIDADKPEMGVQILESSYHLFGKKLDAEIEENEEYGSFPDPDDGMIVVARGAEESFQGRKYVSIDKVSFEERSPLPDEELQSAVDLHAALKILSYDEILNLMNGSDEEENGHSNTSRQDASSAPKNENVNDGSRNEKITSQKAEQEEDEKPDCFGEKWGWDDDECDNCNYWRECRKKSFDR